MYECMCLHVCMYIRACVYIYSTWCCLRFLDVWFGAYHKFGNILSHFYFKYLLCSTIRLTPSWYSSHADVTIFEIVAQFLSVLRFFVVFVLILFFFHINFWYFLTYFQARWFFPWSCELSWQDQSRNSSFLL